jgi:DUF1016 N-terminal domain
LQPSSVVEEARRTAARSINAVMTMTYLEIGRRVVEREQAGGSRAGYGEALLQRLSAEPTKRFGRGFSVDRLETSRLFYLAYPPHESALLSPATLSEEIRGAVAEIASGVGASGGGSERTRTGGDEGC